MRAAARFAYMRAPPRARACEHQGVAHQNERIDWPNLFYFIDVVILMKYLFTSSKKRVHKCDGGTFENLTSSKDYKEGQLSLSRLYLSRYT